MHIDGDYVAYQWFWPEFQSRSRQIERSLTSYIAST